MAKPTKDKKKEVGLIGYIPGHPLFPDRLCLLLDEGSGWKINDLSNYSQYRPVNSLNPPSNQISWTTGRMYGGAAWRGTTLTNLTMGRSDKFLPIDQCTVAFHQRQNGGVQQVATIGVNIFSPDSARMAVYTPFNDNIVKMDWGGIAEGSTRLSVSGLSYDTDVGDTWVFTTGPRGMEIWQNGVKVASNSAVPTRTDNSADFYIGSGAGWSGGALMDFEFVFVYSRQLTESSIVSLFSNPFEFFDAQITLSEYYEQPPQPPGGVGGKPYFWNRLFGNRLNLRPNVTLRTK